MLSKSFASLTLACLSLVGRHQALAVLYPQDGVNRELKRLDGIWRFRLAAIDKPDEGFTQKWFSGDWSKTGNNFQLIAVPASFNDIFQNASVRDHVGWVWYQTTFRVPPAWLADGRRVVLQFGSVHYNSIVFLNGQRIMEHTGGHLPFETEINGHLGEMTENLQAAIFDPNVLTVAVNNTLTASTIPQGSLTLKVNDTDYPPFFYKNEGNFDFFNYAGIHRSVFLYVTPTTYITDVLIVTEKADATESIVRYEVSHNGTSTQPVTCAVSFYNREGRSVLDAVGCSGKLRLHDVKLWWTHTLSDDPGYLYSLSARLISSSKNVVDAYTVRFGVRTVSLNGTKFLLNGKEFYFTGFGKHEDSDVRGRGFDNALNVKDVNLVQWLGANSFRTSHYPYAEELMDLCDQLGVAVIDEAPAVGLKYFSADVLQLHKKLVGELISRDKNRPSVFMWSLANEPDSKLQQSEAYFKQVVEFARTQDATRPLTAALSVDPDKDLVGKFMDVIMFNRYASWYRDPGALQVIKQQTINVFRRWHDKHRKPTMISEYGADTLSGLHASPPVMFTEDYQTSLLREHHRAFDELRASGWFIGEHVWNFADFMTAQGITRVLGNHKGLLTRQRQPKAAAQVLRCRYWALAGGSAAGNDGRSAELAHCFTPAPAGCGGTRLN